MPSPFATQTATSVDDATDAQLKFVTSLIAERDWNNTRLARKYVSRVAVINLVLGFAYAPMADTTPALVSRVINDTVGRNSTYGARVNAVMAYLLANGTAAEGYEFAYAPLTKRGASGLIDWLSALPARDDATARETATRQIAGAQKGATTGGQPTAEEVPAGRYAVDTEDGAVNALAFYKVDRPTEGRWAGYVFVKLMVSDSEERLSRATQTAVLAKIAAVGAEAAAARYGHELGRCGMCDRTLTNDESRARGIGPVCAAKAGW